ncbi:MAG: DUF4271 domain-containing protein [Bacteroidia bacterium]
MSLSPQILQQVQDSVVPSPILVLPIKPPVLDTNTINDKTSNKSKKENKSKNTVATNKSENKIKIAPQLNEPRKDSVIPLEQVKNDTINKVLDSVVTVKIDSSSVNKTFIKQDSNIVAEKFRSSLFRNHELQIKYFEPKERINVVSDWELGVIFLISLLILLNKILNPKKWDQQLKILISKRTFEQQLRDEKDFRSPFLFLQFIASLLTVALFAYQLTLFKTTLFSEENNYTIYFKILLFILALLVVYFISQKIAGFVLQKSKVVSEYLLSTLLLFNISGIFLFPLIIGLKYAHDIPSSVFFNTGIFLLGFFFIFKLYKGLTIASSYNSLYLFYLFLYICTLEILPILIVVKILTENL